jgi:hypothetical protein
VPDRLDPEINPTYAKFGKRRGDHPGAASQATRQGQGENAVLVVQRWIVACLRNRVFRSLNELNVAIGELLVRLNERPFRKLEGCRRSLYELLDKPALSPLPPTRFEKARVNIDYHVEYDLRVYSVPHGLVGEHVDVRATATTIEGRRVGCHRRSYGLCGTAVTLDEHRPKSHP